MPDTQLTVHAALARALQAHEVDILFGLMGDSNLFMVDAFVRNHGGRFVAATNEATAVQMALGYASATGRVGAVTVTQGPAVSNTLTSVIDGVKGTLPIVLLCGDTPVSDPHHPQAVAQEAFLRATGAGFERLKSPVTVFADVATAFRRARVERRPVALNMPTDMMWEAAQGAPQVHPVVHAPSAPSDGPALDDAVGIIAAARRPVLLAGRGAVHARDALVRLADRIGAPLATTLKAKGLFNGLPHDMGVFGTLSTPAAAEAIAAADCILAFGAGLNRFTTVRGANLDGKRLVRVDDTVEILGQFHQADAALACDPGLAAEAMLHWLDAAEIASSQSTDTLEAGTLATPAPLPADNVAPGTVELTRALDAIDAAMPADKLFVADGGRFMGTAWSRITVDGPRNFVNSTNVGAIGLGMGYAVGAAHARLGQPVLFVTGDGGFMLGGLTEFSTVVRDGLDMVVVVCNDEAYGAEWIQFADRQMDPGLSLFSWPSFASVAGAMGATGLRVTNTAGLDAACDAIRSRKGPVLIELMIDPASVPRLHL